ncbi:MAG: dockerin type I domain-containing protein [Ardenticatenales bacterium]
MKRLLVVAMAVFAFSAMAGTVAAQIRPSPVLTHFFACHTSQYDENGDGLLDKSDIMAYIQRVQRSGCWQNEATGLCAQYDKNQDGRVDQLDIQERIDFFLGCVRAPEIITPPGGGAN